MVLFEQLKWQLPTEADVTEVAVNIRIWSKAVAQSAHRRVCCAKASSAEFADLANLLRT